MSLKRSLNLFFLNFSEILLKSSGPWAGGVGNILFLQDHCQSKVRFDLAGEKKSKITELQMFYFSKVVLHGKYKSFPAGRSGLNEDFKKGIFSDYDSNKCLLQKISNNNTL